jgi:NiFe hydrogenase small subunit HydA
MPSQSKPRLLWLQSITCNGNTHSFLNHPELLTILSHFELLHHPILQGSFELEDILEGKALCDILIIEGAYKEVGFLKGSHEVSNIIERYATQAKYIITAGTCATFGGVFKEYDPVNITGFCFDSDTKTQRYESYASKLISLPGCPIHPKWLSFVLMMIAQGRKIALDSLHRPLELYGFTVHQGCSRNEYFEWKVDTKGFGFKEGCLFYELGCQAPYTRGSCNKILWNDISSKTNAGTPCFGCTEPGFPSNALFKTKTNMGIPANMPLGVPKRAYLTITGITKGFKIERLESKVIADDN